MASIFTFDPSPPRVSSPWSIPPPDSRPRQSIPQDSELDRSKTDASSVDYSAITRLEAEPQEGPTEYKLHLLLRRRRSFTYTSTGRHISGSLRRIDGPTTSPVSRSVSETGLLSNTPPPLSSTQSRQHRLEQLTTQLLWRLQQSCPYHISSSTAQVLPQFPNEAHLSAPAVPRRLLPSLEESRGALYEIGIADDGTFVGLAGDEMEESLNNLRAMAASLGCRVDILRMVAVGECEWTEDVGPIGVGRQESRRSKLWVSEAFVRPDQHLVNQEGAKAAKEDSTSPQHHPAHTESSPEPDSNDIDQRTQQLRVSLTGATMSGKSSLLGSLTTATLDNGRGKSRLSLLKHRHEIASGMTSSVTQELIGYRDCADQDSSTTLTQVISYGAGDVSSWVDIHASAEGGRLVLLSDSAGHPRFRRTTVRGLVGWDPHWTLLCIPADNTEDSSGRIGASPTPQELLGPGAADIDLSDAHLQLCLNLELPLVVIITKLDIATKPGLRQTLSKVLSSLKDAGRKPCIISDTSSSFSEAKLNTISAKDLLEARQIAQVLETSPLGNVPIILTSALKGSGITKLHAFLRVLPIPNALEAPSPLLRTLFHIEDIYSKSETPSKSPLVSGRSSDLTAVIGGHLRYGTLRVGDELVLGPYPADTTPDDSDSGTGRGSTPPGHPRRSPPGPISCSFPGALHKGKSGNFILRTKSYANGMQAEWRRVRIRSIRNLRLPMRKLEAGQVGTIGIVPLDLPIASPAIVRIRKGMVLANGEPKANRIIAVKFSGTNAEAVKSLTVGSAVVLYIASVRASAKVLSHANRTAATTTGSASLEAIEDDDAFGFGFDDEANTSNVNPGIRTDSMVVVFQFIASREFAEIGSMVLVVPGGGPGLFGGTERGEKGLASLEGFVGRVVED
ncbi:hypothetical protein CC78DRAFT_456710 [Lojkania enalia]|uniref:Tr-type G domain-containing protein n=1 Tax=Lojkania enalia TaxID=147567 RepID=A0A9P4KIY4_9PLEO|nr:hypothetical protein CC78DRAFT_456710 [Didymosphaeria enalia]